MIVKRFFVCLSILIASFIKNYGQNITLNEQFNGRYDFTFVGNSMNTQENNSTSLPVTQTSSSANLELNTNDNIVKAYLYWAGSGDGDFNVVLNSTPITAERQFQFTNNLPEGTVLTYFGAFADITNLVANTGNGIYTLSDLDISPFEVLHREIRRTNFAGWAILVVYENPLLPLNQINIYDGFEDLTAPFEDSTDIISIELNSLNVLDNQGSKIGFLAWEGDSLLDIRESLKFDSEILSNSQNPPTNAFNSSNSYGNPSFLPNMDMDSYDVQDILNIGASSATIEVSTGRDFVIINTIVTKLNNQLPDASITIDSVLQTCDSRVVELDFTVFNTEATNTLPAGIPISVYINDTFFEFTETTLPIAVNEQWSAQLTLDILETFGSSFTITLKVDDNNGIQIQTELDENNNTDAIAFEFYKLPEFNQPEPQVSCNLGFGKGIFNFSSYSESVKKNPSDIVSFYNSLNEAQNEINPILNTTQFVADSTPKEIFVRIQGLNCPAFTSFLLQTRNCPPTVYNFISANNDGKNDFFKIDGLRNIFLNFKIEIYNRWGKLLWTGGQNDPDWDGYVKDGISIKEASDGTYYYLIFLNDPDYQSPLSGFLYINH